MTQRARSPKIPAIHPPRAQPEPQPAGTPIAPVQVGRTYNHDLLRQTSAQSLCREEYPRVAAVLVDPALIDAFGRFEDAARRYKRLVKRTGTAAITLMVLAFTSAIAGVYSLHRAPAVPPELTRTVEAASLLGLALAFFVSRWGPFRRRWMDNRFGAEVLRLWHFRRVLNAAHVAGSVAKGAPEPGFRPTLTAVLQGFAQSGHVRRAQLSRLGIDPLGEPFAPSLPEDEQLRDEILRAYEKLRVVHQDEFFSERANRQFNDFAGGSNTFWNTAVAGTTGFALAAGLIASSVTILSHSTESLAPLVVMASSVLGIGLRSWSEGMKFEEEEDHYLRMHSQYRALRERWTHSATPEDKLAVAQDLERAALMELRSFLRIHEHAQFIF